MCGICHIAHAQLIFTGPYNERTIQWTMGLVSITHTHTYATHPHTITMEPWNVNREKAAVLFPFSSLSFDWTHATGTNYHTINQSTDKKKQPMSLVYVWFFVSYECLPRQQKCNANRHVVNYVHDVMTQSWWLCVSDGNHLCFLCMCVCGCSIIVFLKKLTISQIIGIIKFQIQTTQTVFLTV